MKPTTESNPTTGALRPEEAPLLDRLLAVVEQWYHVNVAQQQPATAATEALPLAALVNLLHRNPELFGLPKRT